MKLLEIKLAKTESLVLRVCRSDFRSQNGFKWKSKGIVTAPDWKPERRCGYGLHGWLHGVGDPNVWKHEKNDIWLVLAVRTKDLIDLQGKVKFPSCRVLFAGSREVATALAVSHCPGASVNYGTATAGYKGTATAGYKGTATAGDYGTATAGDEGTATAGDYGTATAGDEGTATAGDEGTATAGDYGTATAGDYGTATAGYKGTVIIKYWDSKADRYRIMIGYVGENGLKAGKKYKLNDQAQFIEAK